MAVLQAATPGPVQHGGRNVQQGVQVRETRNLPARQGDGQHPVQVPHVQGRPVRQPSGNIKT